MSIADDSTHDEGTHDGTDDNVAAPSTSPRELAIEARGLTRRFGTKTVVDHIDLSVARGSFFAMLGPNGAGKTTTVRMLTGLLAPSEGTIRILDRSLERDDLQIKKQVGVVPDDLALFDRLSLWEHVTMVGEVYELPEPEIRARGESLLEFLDLSASRDTMAGEASTGMRKKLALALALLHRPDVLFLDEPFEAIDPTSGRHLRSLLERLAQRGVTIFLTSHILEIVERLADEVVILREGKIARHLRKADWTSGASLEAHFLEATGGRAESGVDLDWLL